ncbi:unnamed protein product [Didymodactylos carnosus]|uniref:Uncharacterized protein n=1 Tax=Didymodactylos carnosus TaxID=1234261 RepID=A0A8S2QHJ4_9BILA|nr:unnamed protein product [Didymodactylos carnosus]CAF4105357.1 unnamed protein product [Didymodactylos carnosus]
MVHTSGSKSQHRSGPVNKEYVEDPQKRAETKSKRKKTFLNKLNEYVSKTESTAAVDENSDLKVCDPCKEFNANIEDAMDSQSHRRCRSTQYSIKDIPVKKGCVLCGELFVKDDEILICKTAQCLNTAHVQCLGIVDVRAKALECLSYRCSLHLV